MRHGLEYEERRGEIEGVGWGGVDINNVRPNRHYTYRASYVLRIPPGWDGTLVVFRHGSAPIATWIELEETLGPDNFGRFFHELADRFISDVALDPRRRWAFFAVNQIPVDANGEFTTFLIEEDGSTGAPVQSIVDVPIARDMTRVGQHLLKRLRGRRPAVTIGTGHSAGSVVNFKLNTGLDQMVPGVLVGDNHVTPYDPASGRIHDGFIAFQGAAAAQVDPVRGVSAPMLIVVGEADTPQLQNATTYVNNLINAGTTPDSVTRIYAVRNLSHIDSDFVLATGRNGLGLGSEAELEHRKGGGERLKGLSGALFDALERWITRGTPPPASRFNGTPVDADGNGIIDALTFPQKSGPATSLFGFVDDPAEDTLSGPRTAMTAAQNAAGLARWLAAQRALAPNPDSIVLGETACRRGGFALVTPQPVGTWFTPYDEQTFLARWGSSAAHQTCRVLTVDALIDEDLYDPRVVTVDILPGTFPNVIARAAAGTVPVAIFSTRRFDATRIDPDTLRMGGATLSGDDGDDNRGGHGRRRRPATRVRDVNGDGRPDLLVTFPAADLTFDAHIVADVWGRTIGDVPFSGVDLVQVVP
jgi:hypothetical protein